jgi:hypothetical protein
MAVVVVAELAVVVELVGLLLELVVLVHQLQSQVVQQPVLVN